MATTPGIRPREHMDEILELVRRFGLEADVQVVPSIQDWCKENGVEEDSPFRTGKTLKNLTTGRHLILLPDVITDEMASSVRFAMEFRGFSGAVEQLAEPITFLRHLVLHEIAHGLDDKRSERDCDRWAFQQLKACHLTPRRRATPPRRREAPPPARHNADVRLHETRAVRDASSA